MFSPASQPNRRGPSIGNGIPGASQTHLSLPQILHISHRGACRCTGLPCSAAAIDYGENSINVPHSFFERPLESRGRWLFPSFPPNPVTIGNRQPQLRACDRRFGGRVSGLFPPAVADRLLLSALTAAIAWPVLHLWRLRAESSTERDAVVGLNGPSSSWPARIVWANVRLLFLLAWPTDCS